MRTLIRCSVPVQTGNRALRENILPQVVGAFIETQKPEAAYFTTDNGKRCMIAVFDLKDPSDMPAIAEPFFMQLDAEVSFSPVMNAEDLQKGIAQLKG